MKNLKSEIKKELEDLDKKVSHGGMTRNDLDLVCRLAKTYHYLGCLEDKVYEIDGKFMPDSEHVSGKVRARKEVNV